MSIRAELSAPRPSEKLREIKRHAADVFADRGFHRAGMRDISSATGMSLAGLYYYFSSKDELLYLISESAFSTLLSNLEGPFATTQRPDERLRIFVFQHLDYFLANKNEMKVISHEAQSLTQEYADQVADKKQRYFKVLATLIASLLRESAGAEPGRRVVRVVTLSLFGMMNWIYNWHDPAKDGDARYLADCMTGIFLNGLTSLAAARKANHD
ncbi:MAG: TetR/AcrR family transcriptional regulator [Acidobacteria bacterium]|nr:TetR/AcrR family transcriptional regulator [Acidobacteriota bacterium]